MFSKTDIEKYFLAEKSGSWLLIVLGLSAFVAALIFFFFLKNSFYKGASFPLLLVGLLMGTVGFTVYKRSDADRTRNVYAYDMNPAQLKNREIPRMEKVMRNFVVYRWVEIILMLAGVVLWFLYRNDKEQEFWKGLGAGLALIALVALTVDFFAEKRGRVYLEGLKIWTQNKGGK